MKQSILILCFTMLSKICLAEVTYPEIEIDRAYLEKIVHVLSIQIGARNFNRIEGLMSAASFIKKEFESQGYNVTQQRFPVHEEDAVENLIVSLGPENTERIVIGAHYDSFGLQPGADDNASGIAGLLALAKLLKKYESKLKHQVELVAYTLEEPPFFRTEYMGSYVHAKSLADSNIKIYGMVALEMIGYFTSQEDSQEYPLGLMNLFYPDKGNFIAVVSNFSSSSLKSHFSTHMSKAGIGVETLSAPSFLVGVDFSDHLNYWNFGYDAIMITDTSFYRNPNYHSAGDKIDTLDFGSMVEVVRGVFYAVINIDGKPENE